MAGGTALFPGANLPYFAFLFLIASAPFEMVEPLLSLAGLEITNLELTLSLVLLVWLVWTLHEKREVRFNTPLSWPAVLLLLVMLLSAGLAASYPDEALRFCGRFAAGLLVYLMALNLTGVSNRILPVLTVAFLAGTLAGAFGALEYYEVSGISRWLDPFKEAPFHVGGQLRASSTFQYPTIASMYLEITFGLGLGLLLYTISRGRWKLSALIFAGLLMTFQGVLVTYTRAGPVVILIQVLVLGSLYWRRRGYDHGLRTLILLLLGLSTLLALIVISDPIYRLRLTGGSEEGWYRARFEAPRFLKLTPGEIRRIEVSVTNQGHIPWQSTTDVPFRLSYHWLHSQKNQAVVFEGLRTPFPRRVEPGERIEIEALVQAPPRAGRYYLAWDVVQEHRLWFSTEQPLETFSEAVVEGPPARGEIRLTSLPEPRFHIKRLRLWSAALEMLWSHPLLGVGPDNFRFLYGRYLDLERWDLTWHANNMYLEFLATVGLPAGILFLYFSFQVVRVLWRTWEKTEHTDFSLILGIGTAILAIGIHGFLDYFLPFTSTYIMIWTCCGIAAGAFAKDGPD